VRLAREIQALQKNRDDAAKSLGRTFNPEKLKRLNEQDLESVREVMSSQNRKKRTRWTWRCADWKCACALILGP
jgi:hypothetical protein